MTRAAPASPPAWVLAPALVLGVLLGSGATRPAGAEGPPGVALEILADDLPPLGSVVNAGDQRLFLSTLDGRILVYRDGRVLDQPFLDLRPGVTWGAENGLLGVAFRPDYDETGVFFVYYTDTANRPTLARFRVSGDPDRASPSPEAILLRLDSIETHFGGQLLFGPDRHLYLGIGDGADSYDPPCNAQRLDTLYGKILRLDVDTHAGAEPFYAIPSTNPFVGRAGARGEIWALGLRNPYRLAFDPESGDLFIGDVGEKGREEIDLQPAGSGGENYGWARQEGSSCVDRVASCPLAVPPCDDAALSAPILEYPSTDVPCNAVIAGHVYRGSEIPDLAGRFLYGDYCTGAMRAARRGGSGAWIAEDLPMKLAGLTGFGEDVAGEIYLSTRRGVLARLVREPRSPGCERDEKTLCLASGRFRVEARFATPGAQARAARAVTLSDDTGYFWFLDRGNVELVTKVLDGCSTPLRSYWVFAAGLTNFDVSLTVTDGATEVARLYHSAAGQAFPVIQDTAAFACP